MNVLVTGANGQLGNELREEAAKSRDRFVFTDVTSVPGVETVYLDITNADAVRIISDSENIDVIVNCAAYTNVDKAEDDSATAMLLNSTAAGILAKVAADPLPGGLANRPARSVWLDQAPWGKEGYRIRM